MRESFAIMIGVLVIVGVLFGYANAQQYNRSTVEAAAKIVVDSNSLVNPYADAKTVVMDGDTAYVAKKNGQFFKVETKDTRVVSMDEIQYAEFKAAQDSARGNIQTYTPTTNTQ